MRESWPLLFANCCAFRNSFICCFYIVYDDYTKETEDQLTVKKGDIVGLMEEGEVFWKVRHSMV